MKHLIRSRQAFVAFIHDVVMAAISFLAALYLRLGSWSDFAAYVERLAPTSLPVFVACCAAVFAAMGLYRGIWRYASLNDAIAIVKATAIAIALYLPLQFLLTRLEDLPRSQIFINWLVLVGLLTGPRVAYRILRDRRLDYVLKHDRGRAIPVLVYGAGDETELFLRALARQHNTPYDAVGIVARKDKRVGRRIHGIEVYGTEEQLAEVVARLDRRGRRPRRLVITVPDIGGDDLRALVERADALGMTVARVPRATDFREGAGDAQPGALDLRPIAIEDLLGRPQTVLDRPAMRALCAGKRVLITGAGGSIGSELVRQVSDFGPARLALLDSSEYQLYEIDLELSRRHAGLPRAALLADVRDARRVNALVAAERPELVFHAAALKHVPMVEAHPDEGVLTNAIGTRIVADACVRHRVGAMVVISTDKAVNPSSVMGASKRLAEQYCQALDLAEARKQEEPGTHFVTVRFGNVLGSTGSVVPLFQRQLAEGGPLTVTHPDVDRYFMTVREAVELVLMASAVGAADRRFSGKVFVLDMGQPVKIVELARQMIRLAGKSPERDIKIAFTGLRPGEKLREEVLHAQEDLVPSGVRGILVASPRTSDLKLLARAFDELERHARAGATQESLAALKHLVPEYRPAANGAPDTSAAAT
jgi:O-antigen biosynthesis protein WbqV